MTGPTATLTCPKCSGQMRSYERNGVTVDQCTDCRGIFLDRGELERLIEAEDVHYTSGAGGRGERAVGTDPRAASDDSGYGDEYERGRGRGERKRRGGFLGDLLDFGD